MTRYPVGTMQARWIRIAILVTLVFAGAGAALMTWDGQRRISELQGAARDVDARLDRMIAAAGEVAVAQQAYVVPGQPDAQWLERVSSLAQQLTADVAAARPPARSANAHAALNAIGEAVGALVEVDGRVREHVALGEDLIAADLIVADGRAALDALTARLRSMRVAERAAFEGDQERLARQGWLFLAGAALMWLAGLALLARAPAQAPPAASLSPTPAPTDRTTAAEPREAARTRPPLDLAGAAAVCTALSRMTTTGELPGLLARAATALDASGLIVWMGAGDDLFAATAHGYDPRIIARLGPIARHADNATAACWRSGELRTCAGDVVTNGAIVAPMFGPDACIGVLAVEIRHGREADADAHAITAMLAAQLATAVAAWPAASAAGVSRSSA